jgi:hypothetical protein
MSPKAPKRARDPQKEDRKSAAAVALHTMFYNYVRVHQTLKVSPAIAAGVTDRLWEIRDLVQVLEDRDAQRDSEPIFDVDMHKIDGKPLCGAHSRTARRKRFAASTTAPKQSAESGARRSFGFMSGVRR